MTRLYAVVASRPPAVATPAKIIFTTSALWPHVDWGVWLIILAILMLFFLMFSPCRLPLKKVAAPVALYPAPLLGM